MNRDRFCLIPPNKFSELKKCDQVSGNPFETYVGSYIRFYAPVKQLRQRIGQALRKQLGQGGFEESMGERIEKVRHLAIELASF